MAGANVTIMLVGGLYLLPVFFGHATFAALRMDTDPAGTGALLTELLLFGILAMWFVLPLFVTGIHARGSGVAPSHLLHLPIPVSRLLLVAIAGSFVQPLYWILLVLSTFVFVPLVMAPSPAAGVVAGALFIAGGATLSWALVLAGSALLASRRAREFTTFLVLILGTAIFVFFPELSREEGDFLVTVRDHTWLLMNEAGTEGILVGLRNWTPGAWVVKAAAGEASLLWIGVLAALAVAAALLAHRAFRRALLHPASSGGGRRGPVRSIGTLPFMGSALGALAYKEVRYLLRTLDALFGLIIGVGVAVFLARRPDAHVAVSVLAVPIILSMIPAIPMNTFGLDRTGVDRYRLLPLDGRGVVLSKNVAFFIVYGLQLLPIWIVTAFRFGPGVALGLMAGSVTYALLVVLLGNVTSVTSPAPRGFFNFDSKEQTGGLLPMLYTFVVWILPGLAGLLALVTVSGMVVVEVLLAALLIVVYRATLPSVGRRFDARAERMRDRLAG